MTCPGRKSFQGGLIIMGDLPKWKKYEEWSHCYGWPIEVGNKIWKTVSLWRVTYLDEKKNIKSSLIAIGNLPRWKKYEKWSHCNGLPT